MPRSTKKALLSPSKITAWLDCEHYLTLKNNPERRRNRQQSRGTSDNAKTETTQEQEIGILEAPTDFADMLRKKGDLHERKCLENYKEKFGSSVFEVPEQNREEGESFETWVERVGNPMNGEYEIIFQMPFIYEGVRGIADFLEKTENNGKVVYEPVDSKLARAGAKQGHLLQLLFYTEAVEDLTGERPEKIHVELGSGERESFLVSDYWWYWQRLRKKLIQAVETDSSTDTKPEKCSHCGICEFYWEECRPEWRANDSLVFLSGLRKTHQEALNEVGIETLTGLAAIPESHLSEISKENFDEESEQAFQTAINIWAKKSGNNLDSIHSEWKANQNRLPEIEINQLIKLWRQARLQVITTQTKEIPTHFFSEQEMLEKMTEREKSKRGESLLHLPEMNEHDIYLDFEGHPFWQIEEGIIFLFGYIEKKDGEWEYVQLWSHDKTTEKEKATKLVEFLHDRYKTHPEMHIYHYNHTERALLSDLMNDGDPTSSIVSILGHNFEDSPPEKQQLDELVNAGAFVDLLAVVRNSLQAGTESYSLKEMELLAGFIRNRKDLPEINQQDEDVNEDGSIDKGAGAVFEFELYANADLYGIKKDEDRLKRIADYNKDDVEATRQLHEWLINKRKENKELPDRTSPIPEDQEEETKSEYIQRVEALKEKIINKIEEERSGI
ncbi:MAG: ribonuclease H-like domain-containing protein [Acidimicrobiales bacterium]|nr:hypothetical protein [Acidimicrobiaceae bacterium]